MASSRAMFWRIVRRQLMANRGRLFVVLLALATGAAITAALLNVQIDAKRRLSSEFRAFGANVIITPREGTTDGSSPNTISTSVLSSLPNRNDGHLVYEGAFLYAIDKVSEVHNQTQRGGMPVNAVIVGYGFRGHDIHDILPGSTVSQLKDIPTDMIYCSAGEIIAKKMRLQVGGHLSIGSNGDSCLLTSIERFGGPEDGQIFTSPWLVGRLKWPEKVQKNVIDWPVFPWPDQIQVIELNVPGSPRSVEAYVADVATKFPSLHVRPIRQFSEAQGRIYGKINGLLTATVVLVLILTALCVMAAMTNVAMERRNDVGLMKAIGGATRRVLRLFLTEAALLGLTGGLIGAAIGIALSIGLGKAVFGLAARPRLIVYPISVALTVIVAIASSYPLRRLASVRPASVFRGEA